MKYFSNLQFNATQWDSEFSFDGLVFSEFNLFALETVLDIQTFETGQYNYYEVSDFAASYKFGLAPDSYAPNAFAPDTFAQGGGSTLNANGGPLFADIPGDLSTTATAVINGSVSDTLEVVGDQDWFQITLTAGQRYTFALDGTGGSALVDPLVRLLDSSGHELAQNDDVAFPNRNSLLTFTATTTGTYYVSAQAWAGADVTEGTGDYTLTINEVAPITERTIDGVANFLTDEFWNQRSWAGPNVTYNVQGLSAGAAALAVQAFDAWSDMINLTFTAVTTGGDIVFQDTDSGAYSSSTTSGGTITGSTINISTTWNGGNVNVDSYTFQTFMHEIGHSIGLGHGGPYNGSATYGVDNVYLNDSWAYTVMSYFDQNESGYFGDYRYVLGPQIADILAVQNLYGANTTTRNGDTVYGFNSTETDVHDFSQFARAPGLSIFDTGGIDTLDFSGYSADARIDLNAEAFSDVDNIRGVISIARGTVIENAIGGSGADSITGNSARNELTGGSGNDILDGGAGTDYALYSGANINNYTVTDNGNGTYTITDNVGTDGSDTLSGIEFIRVAGIDYPIDGFPTNSLTSGNDTYAATTGSDIVYGLAGDDTISGFSGADVIFGGAGIDTLYGGSGNDTLLGGDGDDVRLDGQAGNDIIYGGAGNDRLFGQLGDDTLYGGSGDDFVTGSNGADILYGDAGNDLLIGGNGNDFLDGGLDVDRLAGGTGDDMLIGGGGNDRLFGQAGNDTEIGGTGDDFISGELGDDILSGGAGADRLFGSAGVDTLSGGDGDDLLNGGADNDRIDGGDGADSLTGGTGADVFAFDFASANTALDTIFDFAVGSDKIEIAGGLVFADLTFTASPNGQHTTISYNGHEIYVKNVTQAQLDIAQFTFIALAEEPVLDKQSVSEVVSIADNALVSDTLFVTGEEVISGDDNFVFTEKLVVSENSMIGDTGFDDFALDQDILAEFLSYGLVQHDIYIGVESIFDVSVEIEINLPDFTDFFNLI